MAFPNDVPALIVHQALERLHEMGTGLGQVELFKRLDAYCRQLALKVGPGAGAPIANRLLRGTGSGTSAWGQLQAGDSAAGAITTLRNAQGTNTTITPTNASGIVDVPGLSITFTPQSTASEFEVTLSAQANHSAAGGRIQFQLYNVTAAAAVKASPFVGHAAAGNDLAHYLFARWTPATAAPVTIKAQVSVVDAGTGTLNGLNCSILLIEFKA